MNNEQLFKALNNADDKFIMEAGELKPEKKRVIWRAALPCAACAALAVSCIAVYNGRGAGALSSDITASSANAELFCVPLEPPIKDTADFWTGELPVMPLAELDISHGFALDLDRTQGSVHHFLDAERGKAVYAVADGEVVSCGVRGVEDGLTVTVKVNEDLYTRYSLLDYDCGTLVSEGDRVRAGQVIGYSGMTVTGRTGITYSVYAYDPFDYEKEIDDNMRDEWTELCVPIDGAVDFDFFNTAAVISRSERVTPAPRGAEVRAVDDGVIYSVSGVRESVVTVLHHNGIKSCYYHLDEKSVQNLHSGDSVKKGDVIGKVSGMSFSGASGLGYCIGTYNADIQFYFAGYTEDTPNKRSS